MAWTKVQEQGHLASSKTTTTEKTATRIFIAISNAATTAVAAKTATDGTVTIPVKIEAHPDDSSMFAVSIDAKPDEDSPRTVFIVTVEYSDNLDFKAKQNEPNPLDRDDEIEWDFTDATEPYFLDRSDTPKPVVNSAGEPFSAFLERETGSITATVTRNVPTSGTGAYSASTAITYKDAVNSDAFTLDGQTIAIGQAKLKSYTVGAKQTENGTDFRQAKFVLQFKASWDDVVEDRGFNAFADGSTNFGPILNPTTNAPVTSPWPLDGSGGAKSTATATPATLTFVPYNKKAFSGFSFT